MTQVLLAVDFEYDLILFELLSEIDDVTIVARPADEVELLAHCRTGGADVVIIGRYFPGLDAEVVAAITASGAKVLGFGDDAHALEALGITAVVATDADATTMASAIDDIRAATVVPPRPRAPPRRPSPPRRAPGPDPASPATPKPRPASSSTPASSPATPRRTSIRVHEP